ncbi:MAG: single-stranded DNA-binding protein [Sphaerochaetaceae bacterium]
MANDLNVVALVGRLTRDSEIRYSSNGSAICHFSIAVNRRKRTGENQWEDEANFFDCSMFGKSATSMNQYLQKGRQVSVLGELRQGRWEQDGQSRSKVEIVVNSLQLLGSFQAGGNASQGSSQGQPKVAAPAQGVEQKVVVSQPSVGAPVGPEQFDDDAIPF